MLKEHCQNLDAEWAERQKTRQLEMEATSKALAVLNSDEAHDLFSKTLGFVQTQSSAKSTRRTAASKVLAAAAKKSGNPRLAALSYGVKVRKFEEVKHSIDDMSHDLED